MFHGFIFIAFDFRWDLRVVVVVVVVVVVLFRSVGNPFEFAMHTYHRCTSWTRSSMTFLHA